MNKKKVCWAMVAVLLVLGIGITGCATSQDPFVGWYEMPSRDRVIPVIKHGDRYYSVLWQGMEVPLELTSEGLIWAMTPSSMTGTTIGFDEEMEEYFLKLFDAQAANFSSESEYPYGTGEIYRLTKIDKPAWIHDTPAKRPQTLDDYIGLYEHTWVPYMRARITKEVDKFFCTLWILKNNSWEEAGDRYELETLHDQLAFTFLMGRERLYFAYNESLRRYEIIQVKDVPDPPVIPMTKISTTNAKQKQDIKKSFKKVGIPTWH